MAVKSQLSGTITVGETGLPEISQSILPTSLTISKRIAGKKAIAAGTANQAISFEGITAAYFIWLKATDASGNPRYMTPRIVAGSNLTLPQCTDFILNLGDTPAAPITGVDITTSAVAGDTTVEYIIAGT